MKNKFFLLFLLNLFSIPISSTKINLVWQIKRNDKIWEEEWLNKILEKFEINNIDDCDYQCFLDNSIVVISTGSKIGYKEYIEKLHAMDYKFGVIYLSDELYEAPIDFYKDTRFVFRNYWHKKFATYKNVYTFPLGYKSGFWRNCSKEIKGISDRIYTWSFAGQITKTTRIQMITQMEQIPNYFIHKIPTWGAPNSLPVDAYRNLLLKTIFVPCPRGNWNLDSFRVYEALECGCIPIVEKNPIDYFKKYFGNHPFVAVDTWDQAPKLINELLANPTLLEERRKSCYQWWLSYKEKLKENLSKVIEETFYK